MLIILIGATLDVSSQSRQYFENKGYEYIQKYNFLPEDSISEHYDNRYQYHSKEVVEACNLTYPVHGGLTGFNRKQVIDAVRGRSNALLTASPDNLEFAKELKDAFGEYVQLIYLYIDKNSLEIITRKHIKAQNDIEKRLKKGADLRSLFCSERSLFNNVVIYEENGEFDFSALYNQFDKIIEDAETLQTLLNKTSFVDFPYKGNEPYIFVSYSHQDEKTVSTVLSALQRHGFRIWFDEGIHAGASWREVIGEKICGCTSFLLFSSKDAVESNEVRVELDASLSQGQKPLTVRLDETKFPFGYEMYLCKYQNLSVKDKNLIPKLIDGLNPNTKVNA